MNPTPDLSPLGERVLEAIVKAPTAWEAHRKLGRALERKGRPPVRALRREAYALEAAGWIVRWDRRDGRHWTLSPWGASRLGVRIVERQVAVRRRVKVRTGWAMDEGDAWWVWDRGGWRAVCRGRAWREVWATEYRAGWGEVREVLRRCELTEVLGHRYETVVREIPRWADADEPEPTVVLPEALGITRVVSLDWLPERPAPVVIDEGGREAEVVTDDEGQAVVILGQVVTRPGKRRKGEAPVRRLTGARA
jgi:hypothetical protein